MKPLTPAGHPYQACRISGIPQLHACTLMILRKEAEMGCRMQNGKACNCCARAEQHRWLRGQRKRWALPCTFDIVWRLYNSLALKLAE